MEEEFPHAFIADDGAVTLFPVGHIIENKDKHIDECEDGKDGAQHGVAPLKTGSGSADGRDLQEDAADEIGEIVEFGRAGFHIFDICQAEKSGDNTAETAVKYHGKEQKQVKMDPAFHRMIQHNAAKDKNHAQNQPPDPLEPADGGIRIAEEDGVVFQRMIRPPHPAPGIGQHQVADHAAEQQDVEKRGTPERHKHPLLSQYFILLYHKRAKDATKERKIPLSFFVTWSLTAKTLKKRKSVTFF